MSKEMETSKEEQPSTPVSNNPVPVDFDRLTKVVALTAGSLYVTGLLTVNTYLYRLGIAEFSLFKAQYIYTGALTLSLIVLCTLCPLYGFFAFRYRRTHFQKFEPKSSTDKLFLKVITSWWLYSINLLVMVGIPFLVLFVIILSKGHDHSTPFKTAFLIYFVSATVGIISISIGALFRLKQAPQDHRKGSVPKALLIFAATIFFAAYIIWYLGLFTNHIYKVIPEQFGGGKAKKARFLFKAETIKGINKLGIDVSPEFALTPTVEVLFEGDKFYLVRIPESRIIRVNKEIIIAIELLSSK